MISDQLKGLIQNDNGTFEISEDLLVRTVQQLELLNNQCETQMERIEYRDDWLDDKYKEIEARIAALTAKYEPISADYSRMKICLQEAEKELAALREQKPVYWQFRSVTGCWIGIGESGKDKAVKDGYKVRPLFYQPVPAAPVAVPDKLPKQLEVVGYNDGWNACRAEVLRLNSGSKSDD